jgi:hypothetical protein
MARELRASYSLGPLMIRRERVARWNSTIKKSSNSFKITHTLLNHRYLWNSQGSLYWMRI